MEYHKRAYLNLRIQNILSKPWTIHYRIGLVLLVLSLFGRHAQILRAARLIPPV